MFWHSKLSAFSRAWNFFKFSKILYLIACTQINNNCLKTSQKIPCVLLFVFDAIKKALNKFFSSSFNLQEKSLFYKHPKCTLRMEQQHRYPPWRPGLRHLTVIWDPWGSSRKDKCLGVPCWNMVGLRVTNRSVLSIRSVLWECA